MTKKIIGFLAKAFITYVALVILLMDLTLFEAAIPRYIFEKQPFIHSAALAIAVAAIASMLLRSRTPVIFVAMCIGYSAFVFVYIQYAAWFIAICGLVAAISFLFRNKITEPFLVLLLVIAGAWAFISSVYIPYFVGWANYVTGHNDFFGSVIEAIRAAFDQIIPTLALMPVLVMYFLGKQSYLKLLPVLLRIFSKKIRFSP